MRQKFTEEEKADILAARYVDGSWPYSQSLEFAKNDGVSKEALDKAIVECRRTLGEEEYIENDIREGLVIPNAAKNL